MKVQDVMTKSVATCEMQDTLHAAAQKLWELDCGCLPVVDQNRRPVAMITDRDACMAAFTTGRALHELHVAEAMSKQVVSCRAHEELSAAAARMSKHGVRRLPVLDANGVLVGVLSLNDLAITAAREPVIRNTGATADAMRVLMAVSAHRSNSSAPADRPAEPTVVTAPPVSSSPASSLPMSAVIAKTPPAAGGLTANA